MPRFHLRIVAIGLVFCLVVNPATATEFISAKMPARIQSVHFPIDRSSRSRLTQEALTLSCTEVVQPIHPTPRVRLAQWSPTVKLGADAADLLDFLRKALQPIVFPVIALSVVAEALIRLHRLWPGPAPSIDLPAIPIGMILVQGGTWTSLTYTLATMYMAIFAGALVLGLWGGRENISQTKRPSLSEHVVNAPQLPAATVHPSFTPIEEEVFILLALGHTNKEIAVALQVSRADVISTAKCIYQKAFSKNKHELLVKAYQQHWVEPTASFIRSLHAVAASFTRAERRAIALIAKGHYTVKEISNVSGQDISPRTIDTQLYSISMKLKEHFGKSLQFETFRIGVWLVAAILDVYPPSNSPTPINPSILTPQLQMIFDRLVKGWTPLAIRQYLVLKKQVASSQEISRQIMIIGKKLDLIEGRFHIMTEAYARGWVLADHELQERLLRFYSMLTDTECEVIKTVAKGGYHVKLIAQIRGSSIKTIDAHIFHIHKDLRTHFGKSLNFMDYHVNFWLAGAVLGAMFKAKHYETSDIASDDLLKAA
jgi:DNA-binding CsgD family transcriptional regulator